MLYKNIDFLVSFGLHIWVIVTTFPFPSVHSLFAIQFVYGGWFQMLAYNAVCQSVSRCGLSWHVPASTCSNRRLLISGIQGNKCENGFKKILSFKKKSSYNAGNWDGARIQERNFPFFVFYISFISYLLGLLLSCIISLYLLYYYIREALCVILCLGMCQPSTFCF